MKKQNDINELVFNKKSIIELNDAEQLSVAGGTSPLTLPITITVSIIISVIDQIEK